MIMIIWLLFSFARVRRDFGAFIS